MPNRKGKNQKKVKAPKVKVDVISKKEKSRFEERMERERQKTANAAATLSIKRFLSVPPYFNTHPETCAWELHCLCRTDTKEEGSGFERDEIENFHRFLKNLSSFFMRSNHASVFNSFVGNQDELCDRLNRLIDYFNSLMSYTIYGECDLVSTEHFKSVNAKRCSDLVWLYDRETRLAEAHNQAMSAPNTSH